MLGLQPQQKQTLLLVTNACSLACAKSGALTSAVTERQRDHDIPWRMTISAHTNKFFTVSIQNASQLQGRVGAFPEIIVVLRSFQIAVLYCVSFHLHLSSIFYWKTDWKGCQGIPPSFDAGNYWIIHGLNHEFCRIRRRHWRRNCFAAFPCWEQIFWNTLALLSGSISSDITSVGRLWGRSSSHSLKISKVGRVAMHEGCNLE